MSVLLESLTSSIEFLRSLFVDVMSIRFNSTVERIKELESVDDLTVIDLSLLLLCLLSAFQLEEILSQNDASDDRVSLSICFLNIVYSMLCR